MALEHLTQSNFHETIASSPVPVIVDFYASWCGPCKMIAPVLESMAATNNGEYAVYKVDTDNEPELAMEFRVTSIPSIISFKGGALYKRILGAVPREAIEDLVR